MNRMTRRQKIEAAKSRMEHAGTELARHAQNAAWVLDARKNDLFRLARQYAARVGTLTRVRK